MANFRLCKHLVIYIYKSISSLIVDYFQKTRMKTSISSKALSHLGAKKITFSPKHEKQTDIRTDGHTDGWTDISIYRVALVLKKYIKKQLGFQS